MLYTKRYSSDHLTSIGHIPQILRILNRINFLLHKRYFLLHFWLWILPNFILIVLNELHPPHTNTIFINYDIPRLSPRVDVVRARWLDLGFGACASSMAVPLFFNLIFPLLLYTSLGEGCCRISRLIKINHTLGFPFGAVRRSVIWISRINYTSPACSCNDVSYLRHNLYNYFPSINRWFSRNPSDTQTFQDSKMFRIFLLVDLLY